MTSTGVFTIIWLLLLLTALHVFNILSEHKKRAIKTANIIAVQPGNNKRWSPNQHKLNMVENMMVDLTVKSKKDTPPKLTPGKAVTMLIFQIKRIN